MHSADFDGAIREFDKHLEVSPGDFQANIGLGWSYYHKGAYDLAHPKIGIPVVRVLIPGLQPNFHAKGLHYLDKKAIVTPHLNIYREVMEKIRKREFWDQQLDEVQDLNG